MAAWTIEERPAWRRWVTPKSLEDTPIHRWCVFPHSYTRDLVHALADEWGLGPQDHLLDPFVGAGTTLLAAKERGIPCTGYDLLPLAVLAARVKTTDYDTWRLEQAWRALRRALLHSPTEDPAHRHEMPRQYPNLVQRALPGPLLGAFDAVARAIDLLPCSDAERDFFRLALLTTIPRFSTAVATGGWLKWIERPISVPTGGCAGPCGDAASVPKAFAQRVEAALRDVAEAHLPRGSLCRVHQADARSLPDPASTRK